MYEHLFKFPVVMVDGDNEERKQAEKKRFGDIPTPDGGEELEYDMVFGEAEYPFWDFIGIEDRWLPSPDSFNKALNQRFEACIVRFANVGQILVPWSRKKFKSEIIKFAEHYEATKPTKPREVRVITLTPDQFKEATDDAADNTEK